MATEYKVVPFTAQLNAGQGSDYAARQLEGLVNKHSGEGWSFLGLEALETLIVTPSVPGSNGCVGIGAYPETPERRDSASAYVAVFQKLS